jgi:hypothetical protein
MSQTTSRGSPHTQLLPLQPSPSLNSDHTLPRRPWRRYTTPFPSLLAHAYPGSGTRDDPYLVDWLPSNGDPENPLAWGEAYKWAVMAIATGATLGVALASSAL